MKRSNIILIGLIVCLYAIPAIIWSVYKYKPEGSVYTGFGEKFQIVRIDNPSLSKEDIIIKEDRASGFPHSELLQPHKASHLYYMGNKQYLPQIEKNDIILDVGLPQEKTDNEKLKLHIWINSINKVILNGETIWTRQNAEETHN